MVVILTVITFDEGFVGTPTFAFDADLDLLPRFNEFLLVVEF